MTDCFSYNQKGRYYSKDRETRSIFFICSTIPQTKASSLCLLQEDIRINATVVTTIKEYIKLKQTHLLLKLRFTVSRTVMLRL